MKGYRVTIGVRQAIAESTSLAGQSYYRSILNQGVHHFSEQIWLNEAGDIKKLRYRYASDLSSTGGVTVTQVYSYTHKPFVVITPPAADTTPVANAVQAFSDAYLPFQK